MKILSVFVWSLLLAIASLPMQSYAETVIDFENPAFQGYTEGMAKALGLYDQYQFC